jgi:hypothetical protein
MALRRSESNRNEAAEGQNSAAGGLNRWRDTHIPAAGAELTALAIQPMNIANAVKLHLSPSAAFAVNASTHSRSVFTCKPTTFASGS